MESLTKVQQVDPEPTNNSRGNSKSHRIFVLNSRGSFVGLSSDKISATPTHSCNEREPEPSNINVPQPRLNSGIRGVGKEFRTFEGQVNSNLRYQGNNSDRRLKKGLGCVLSKQIRRMTMDPTGEQFSTHVLELKGIKLALSTFVRIFELKRVHFQIDNMTALSYLIKMGGTSNREIIAISKKIWNFAMSREITITAGYLPGKLNINC